MTLYSSQLMKPIRTWILVADGSRARILCSEGPGRGVKPMPEHVFEVSREPDREIDADRPGRTFDSVGGGRHAKEPRTSPQRHRKAAFARELAGHLAQQRAGGAFDRLLVVAPPAMLGDLRPHFTKEIERCLVAEVRKDLTGIPDHEIGKHLGDVLAV